MKHSFYNIARLRTNISRFLVAGTLNTGITIIIYQSLIFIISPSMSYCISWCVGVILVSVIYPYFVFRANKTSSSNLSIKFALIYIICFFVGLAFNQVLILIFNIPRLAIIFTLCFTASISFLLMQITASRSYDNKY